MLFSLICDDCVITPEQMRLQVIEPVSRDEMFLIWMFCFFKLLYILNPYKEEYIFEIVIYINMLIKYYLYIKT